MGAEPDVNPPEQNKGQKYKPVYNSLFKTESEALPEFLKRIDDAVVRPEDPESDLPWCARLPAREAGARMRIFSRTR